MFTGESGGQISWLLPAALIALVAGLVIRGRRARTDAERAQYMAWGGWLLGTAGVFSFMSGLFHDYYTVALAPAIAALVGIGGVDLWRRREQTGIAIVLASVVAVSGVWAWVLLGRTPGFVPWLRWIIVGVSAAAAIGLVVAAVVPPTTSRVTGVRIWAAAMAIAASLAGPVAYSVQTVSTAHTGGVVTAGPQIPGLGLPGAPSGGSSRPGSIAVSGSVAQMLSEDSATYTWVAAVPGSTEAGYYQLASDQPVMALGGFGSGDPAPTLQQFQDYVADGRIHYYIPSMGLGLPKQGPNDSDGPGLKPPGLAGGTSEAERIGDWVKEHYTPITIDGVTLYDLTKPVSR